MAECASTRYAVHKPCGPVDFEVVYSVRGNVTDAHPTCFVHGLAEVDRHYASAGMSQCELKPKPVDHGDPT